MSEIRKPTPENSREPENSYWRFVRTINNIFDKHMDDFDTDDETLEQQLNLVKENNGKKFDLTLKRKFLKDRGEFVNHSIVMETRDSKGATSRYTCTTENPINIMDNWNAGGIWRKDEYNDQGLDNNPVGYTTLQMLEFAKEAEPSPVSFYDLRSRHYNIGEYITLHHIFPKDPIGKQDNNETEEPHTKSKLITIEEARNAAGFFNHFIDDIFSERKEDVTTYTEGKASTVEEITFNNSHEDVFGVRTLATTISRETSERGIKRRVTITYERDYATTYLTFSSEDGILRSRCNNFENGHLIAPDYNPLEIKLVRPNDAKQLRKFLKNPRIE